MTILIIISTLIYIYMLYHTYKCKKDIECLSDIAYDKHKWLFSVSMILMALFMLPCMLLNTQDNLQFLCFLTCCGVMGLSVTPYLDDNFNYKVHYTCSVIAMLSLTFLWFTQELWFLPFLFVLSSIRKKWLLGLEMGLLASSFAYALI